MKRISTTIAALALTGVVAAACTNTDVTSGAIGAAAGTGAALLAGGTTETVLLSAAAGAAVGVVIGRVANSSNQCYYANGKGGYYKGRC